MKPAIDCASRGVFPALRRNGKMLTLISSLSLSFIILGVFLSGEQQRRQRTITAPFVLDHNRVFVDLQLAGFDGVIHNTRAFVDMADQDLELTKMLAKQLQVEQGKNVQIRIGGTPLVFDESKVSARSNPGESIMGGGEPKVEANLPATIMMNYDVVFDYKARTMTLAPPGTIRHGGFRIPCRVNRRTGLVSVDMKVGARTYAVTVDNGSAYTWIRKQVVQGWVDSQRDWLLGVGAIGNANMNGSNEEASALLARIPVISVDSLEIKDAGLAGYAMQLSPGNEDIFDWYSEKAPEKVAGFIGGNVLKSFRIEIDYAQHETYWVQQAAIDRLDTEQVPLTIRPEPDGSYTVIGVFTRNGQKQIEGVQRGDKLIKVGNLEVKGATFGTILDALHGEPGETRALELERGGKRFGIAAKVF